MVRSIISMVFIGTFCIGDWAQSATINYQGLVKVNGSPANGNYDVELDLYTASTGGTFIGGYAVFNVPVVNGVFASNFTFPQSLFSASPRYVEVSVKPSSGGPWTTLAPRQLLTQTPFAINAAMLNGVGPSGYIQNGSSQQATTNFNIGGTGSATVFNAVTQYDLGGQRLVGTPGSENIFVGIGTGASHTTGIENAFFGRLAGEKNTEGSGNSYFGFVAGRNYVTGSYNSIFGNRAGAGFFNGNGSFNSFFGHRAGEANQSGNSNSFFGTGAGIINSTGGGNTFIGHDAGKTNSQGSLNTALGDSADVFPSNVTNATAIGANARATQANSLVLGSINGINGATADTSVGIGTTAPGARLDVSGTGVVRSRVNSDSNAGLQLTLNNQPGWSVATVSGGQFQIFNDSIGSNAVWIDKTTNNVGIGTNAPADKLDVNGIVRLGALGSVGGTQLCRNLSNQISNCSSSLRYKTNVIPFAQGLSLVNRLRPIAYDWKQGGGPDVGFGAEEVAAIDPRFVTYNERGEIEGVKYDRLTTVLVNAVKEQQAEIQRLEKTIADQERQMDAMKAALCKIKLEPVLCTP